MLAPRPEGVPEDAEDITGDGGLCKRILVAGDEAAGTPFHRSQVQVHYVGTLMDGTKFDSSRDRPGNFAFQIGIQQVVKAWDTGVATMHKGEKCEFFCRADYAYGKYGNPPRIPPNATLKFEVELLSWAERAKERYEMNAEEKCAEALKWKEEGAAAFKAGKWQVAHGHYSCGWDWVEHESFVKDEKDVAGEVFNSCLLNAAQCSIKLKDWPAAVESCTKLLGRAELPSAPRVKALYRRGISRTRMSEYAAARADLKQACLLEPKSREIREAFAAVKEAEVAAKEFDVSLAAKMVKGVGGARCKPPEGVPEDAEDISGDGGLCKRLLREGRPSEGKPFPGSEARVHYVGTLMDGTTFDSSRDRPGNFSFIIGQGQVIKAWDKGVATMHKGEKCEFFCRADYAYGESGSPPRIPPNATLKFEVELLSWDVPLVGADDDDDDPGDDEEEIVHDIQYHDKADEKAVPLE